MGQEHLCVLLSNPAPQFLPLTPSPAPPPHTHNLQPSMANFVWSISEDNVHIPQNDQTSRDSVGLAISSPIFLVPLGAGPGAPRWGVNTVSALL